jgi:hypothetical protein
VHTGNNPSPASQEGRRTVRNRAEAEGSTLAHALCGRELESELGARRGGKVELEPLEVEERQSVERPELTRQAASEEGVAEIAATALVSIHGCVSQRMGCGWATCGCHGRSRRTCAATT